MADKKLIKKQSQNLFVEYDSQMTPLSQQEKEELKSRISLAISLSAFYK